MRDRVTMTNSYAGNLVIYRICSIISLGKRVMKNYFCIAKTTINK